MNPPPPCGLRFQKLETGCVGSARLGFNRAELRFRSGPGQIGQKVSLLSGFIAGRRISSPRVSKPEFMVCVSALFNWSFAFQGERVLAVEIPSVWVSVSDESVLMEQLECFRILPRGRQAVVEQEVQVCVCMSNISRPRLEFPSTTVGLGRRVCKAEVSLGFYVQGLKIGSVIMVLSLLSSVCMCMLRLKRTLQYQNQLQDSQVGPDGGWVSGPVFVSDKRLRLSSI